jgi:hypothetical protein
LGVSSGSGVDDWGDIGMIEMLGRRLAAFGIVAAVAATAFTAAAQSTPPVRVRGAIEAVDGSVLKVKSRDGADLTIRLADNATVAGVVPATLADVKPGSFVGIASLTKDGTLMALEVLIFPEAMRGTGEGHYGWDLMPDSMMTNATVAETVGEAKGQTLKLKYKDGEKSITVPKEAPIVTFVPADRSELKPGAKIFIGGAQKQPDGTLLAARVNVGKDGMTPPM